MRAHSNAFRPSSIVRASSHKRLNISETERAIGLKLSSNGVLLINIAIAIFAKNPIRRVFPGLVTIWFLSFTAAYQ